MKKITAACFVAVLTMLLPLLTACGKSGLSTEEMRETYRTLVEQSYLLNDVYYGDGLPAVEDEEKIASVLGMAELGGISVNYLPVAEDAPLQSEAEIRAATAAVFSPALCEDLYEIAFSGVSTEDEEKVAFARYIDHGEIMTVRIGLADDALPLGRTYDFEAMTVITDEADRVRAEFPSYVDGEKSINVKITIVKTADGWRLDSPTY